MRFFIYILVIIMVIPWSRVEAQDIFDGGRGSNLVVREGNLEILNETVQIKLHLGFAEVSHALQLKNGNSPQNVVLGLPYRLGLDKQSFSNFELKINNVVTDVNTIKEAEGQTFLYWKTFPLSFAPEETKEITLSHWQLNGANIRGLRTFNYSFKNQWQTKINNLSLRLILMDGAELKNFNKSVNLDLDLKLEPMGGKCQQNECIWQWLNTVPSFEMAANFYWDGGDLARVSSLDAPLSLYQNINQNPEINAMIDSSYLTGYAISSASTPVTIIFPARNVAELRIIPGLTNSPENYLKYGRPKDINVGFTDGTSQNFTLTDTMAMQYLKLNKPVTTDRISLSATSFYPGQIDQNIYLSELEIGSEISANDIATKTVLKSQKKSFIQNWYNGFMSLIKKIFKIKE